MVVETVPIRRGGLAESVAALLNSAEIVQLIAELEGFRWTGRKGYPTRSLVGACLTKSLYAIPTWSRTARLIGEHPVLRAAIGGAPSVYALYRFTRKLRTQKPLLDACIDRVTASLREQLPGYGEDIAIDASDLAAYANGQRYLSKHGPERERFSDPDASWGHRSAVSTRKGGGFYGYKLHAAVCARTELPVAWRVETARDHESSFALPPLDAVLARGFQPETCAMDKGLRHGVDPRRVRGTRLPTDRAAEENPGRQDREAPCARLRARPVDICGCRLQAEADQVALPNRSVQARLRLAQSLSAAPADSA